MKRGIVAGPFCLVRVCRERLQEGEVTRIGWTVVQESNSGGSIRFPSDHRHRPCALSMARAYAVATDDQVLEP